MEPSRNAPDPPSAVAEWLGITIRTLRQQRDWSAATLAQHCQAQGPAGARITKVRVVRMETVTADRPQQPPTVHELIVLAAALGVPAARLLPPPEALGLLSAEQITETGAQIERHRQRVEAVKPRRTNRKKGTESP